MDKIFTIVSYVVAAIVSGYLSLFSMSAVFCGIGQARYEVVRLYIAIMATIGGIFAALLKRNTAVYGSFAASFAFPLMFLYFLIMGSLETAQSPQPFPVHALWWFQMPFLIGALVFIPSAITALCLRRISLKKLSPESSKGQQSEIPPPKADMESRSAREI